MQQYVYCVFLFRNSGLSHHLRSSEYALAFRSARAAGGVGDIDRECRDLNWGISQFGEGFYRGNGFPQRS
jgi:hypothetical protein